MRTLDKVVTVLAVAAVVGGGGVAAPASASVSGPADVGRSGVGGAGHGGFDSPFELPLESRFVDFALYGAAVDAFMAECMAQSGLEYPVGTWDVTQPAVPAFTALGYPNLGEDVVEEFGYRMPSDPRLIVPPADLSGSIPPGEEDRYAQAQEACAEKSLGPVPDIATPANILYGLHDTSVEMAANNPRIAASTKRWRECVVRAKPPIGDVGGSPTDFRNSVLTAVDVREGWTVDSYLQQAPADEIESARIDVGCRERSGYDKAYFSAVGKAQRRLIAENRRTLDEVKRSMGEIQLAIDHYVLKKQ